MPWRIRKSSYNAEQSNKMHYNTEVSSKICSKQLSFSEPWLRLSEMMRLIMSMRGTLWVFDWALFFLKLKWMYLLMYESSIGLAVALVCTGKLYRFVLQLIIRDVLNEGTAMCWSLLIPWDWVHASHRRKHPLPMKMISKRLILDFCLGQWTWSWETSRRVAYAVFVLWVWCELSEHAIWN